MSIYFLCNTLKNWPCHICSINTL
ncbi:MAG: hypothetical protein LBI72_09730 [Flavobacteriaceae bacterium]|nr:hypothetical protein [Flavobacteriaceae bacterium]